MYICYIHITILKKKKHLFKCFHKNEFINFFARRLTVFLSIRPTTTENTALLNYFHSAQSKPFRIK